jgi:hypothetical protein
MDLIYVINMPDGQEGLTKLGVYCPGFPGLDWRDGETAIKQRWPKVQTERGRGSHQRRRSRLDTGGSPAILGLWKKAPFDRRPLPVVAEAIRCRGGIVPAAGNPSPPLLECDYRCRHSIELQSAAACSFRIPVESLFIPTPRLGLTASYSNKLPSEPVTVQEHRQFVGI